MSRNWIIVSIDNGEIKNKKTVSTFFKSLNDGRSIIESKDFNERSNKQNRYYHGLVIPMIQAGIKDLGTDLSKDEVHEFLKSKFNGIELVNKRTGQYETVPGSTTRLNKEEFNIYIEKIQRFAAEFLSIVIPDPGVQTEFAI